MDEGEGAYGEVGDQVDHIHRNEAISAVADEGFLGDEDDDYEDLYNDVNVGENFLQSMRKNDDSGFRNEVIEEKRSEQPMVTRVPPAGGADFPVSGAVDGAGNVGSASGPGDPRGLEYQNQGFKRNEVKGPVGLVVSGGSGGMRVELAQRPKANEIEERNLNNIVPGGPPGLGQQVNGSGVGNLSTAGVVGGMGNVGFATQGNVRNMSAIGGSGAQSAGVSSNVVAVAGPVVGGNVGGGGGASGGGGGGGTMLFVGDLHWWTTDADLEAELCKYGQVKEVRFFDEKASGKSKGYCQVEFFDSVAATACKEGMNGHLFNGRPCVVAFATPFTIKRMGEAQVNRSQQAPSTGPQARRGPNDMVAKTGGNNVATGGDFQGGDNRSFGRGNWGRGNGQGMGNRGAAGGPMRNRGGGMGGRGLMGNGGHGFGQGMPGGPPMLHPQAMMGQGFDPAFGGPMGRLGAYGGFPGAPGPPFSGLMPSFPPVGLPGVAPHVNPAIFGRGIPMNGMGMMPSAGMEVPNMGMWSDPNMGGWGGDEHGGSRAGESSYGEEAASEHQYTEANHDRGGWPNSSKEKERGSERDWSGSSDRRYPDDRETYDRDVTREKDSSHDREWSERRHRDERDSGRERDKDHERDREHSRDRDRDREPRDRNRERYREDREKHSDHHRHRDHEPDHADEYERGRSSRTHSKSRLSQEDDHRSRSRDADYALEDSRSRVEMKLLFKTLHSLGDEDHQNNSEA